MNKEDLLPFELEKAKQGWPVVCNLYGNYFDVINFKVTHEDVIYVFYKDENELVRHIAFKYKDDWDVGEVLYLKPKKEPQLGDRIWVKRDSSGDWLESIFIKFGNGMILAVNEDHVHNYINGYEFDVLGWSKWKWPEEDNKGEKESELKEIGFIDDPQNAGEVGEKLNDLIFAVNKLIRERDEPA